MKAAPPGRRRGEGRSHMTGPSRSHIDIPHSRVSLEPGSGPLERIGSHSAIQVGLNLNSASQADLELEAILLPQPPDGCITIISLHTQLPRRDYLK